MRKAGICILPVAHQMVEHCLIERMIPVLKTELEVISSMKKPDPMRVATIREQTTAFPELARWPGLGTNALPGGSGEFRRWSFIVDPIDHRNLPFALDGVGVRIHSRPYEIAFHQGFQKAHVPGKLPFACCQFFGPRPRRKLFIVTERCRR